MSSNYKLLQNSNVWRLDDGALIPTTMDNLDWVTYQKWLAAGNIPQAADLASTPPSTAVSTVTVGASPFVWRNTASGPITLIIVGGTVSLVEISRDNITYYSVGLLVGAIRVAAGDYIRVTYLVAPTIKLFP